MPSFTPVHARALRGGIPAQFGNGGEWVTCCRAVAGTEAFSSLPVGLKLFVQSPGQQIHCATCLEHKIHGMFFGCHGKKYKIITIIISYYLSLAASSWVNETAKNSKL